MRTKLASRRQAATLDDPDGVQSEKAVADSAAAGKYRAQVARLRTIWARTGYDPERHFVGMTAEGDANVLSYMLQPEYPKSSRVFGAFLATRDILDMLRRRPRQPGAS